MFAYDTNITIPGCTFASLEQATNSELINLYNWLKANKLNLDVEKTEFTATSTRQIFLAENCSEINIQIDSQPICRFEHAKSLGLITDDGPLWSYHIRELCRKISSAPGALKRIRSLISLSTAVQICLTIIPLALVRYEMIDSNEARSAELAMIISYPTSASGIIVLLKTIPKYRNYIKIKRPKTHAHALHFCRSWYNCSYTIMFKPMKTLELHYPMIEFFIKRFNPTSFRLLCPRLGWIEVLSM